MATKADRLTVEQRVEAVYRLIARLKGEMEKDGRNWVE
jgi:hypothetical protein